MRAGRSPGGAEAVASSNLGSPRNQRLEVGVSPAPQRHHCWARSPKPSAAQGGWVCGPRVLIDYLVGTARPVSSIRPASIRPPSARLWRLCKSSKREPATRPKVPRQCRVGLARELNCDAWHGTPIIPVLAADSEAALQLSARLLERGLWCPAIRPPTVKRARLRLTSCASWDEATLRRIVAGFRATHA